MRSCSRRERRHAARLSSPSPRLCRPTDQHTHTPSSVRPGHTCTASEATRETPFPFSLLHLPSMPRLSSPSLSFPPLSLTCTDSAVGRPSFPSLHSFHLYTTLHAASCLRSHHLLSANRTCTDSAVWMSVASSIFSLPAAASSSCRKSRQQQWSKLKRKLKANTKLHT